jgi:predicted Zn-dependent peptidase
MGLESQLTQLEDLGRRVFQGNDMNVNEIIERINMVEDIDIVRTARRVLFGEKLESRFGFDNMKIWDGKTTRPTVLVQGPIGKKDALLNVNLTMEKWGLMGNGGNKWF